MSLFSDLYNTLAKFFRSSEEQQGDASKSVATNRLKLVLMQDRTNLTPRILEQMRSELIDLLSRYVELDKELLDLNFEQEGDQVALMLSIPVIRAKDEEEIDAAIKEHEEMLKAAAAQKAEIEEITNEEPEVSEETITEESTEENAEDSAEEKPIVMEASEASQIRDEEEQADVEKADAIAKELNDVPKIIKKKNKKEVSAPEEMNSSSNNNPFKTEDIAEFSTEN